MESCFRLSVHTRRGSTPCTHSLTTATGDDAKLGIIGESVGDLIDPDVAQVRQTICDMKFDDASSTGDDLFLSLPHRGVAIDSIFDDNERCRRSVIARGTPLFGMR